MSRGTTLYTGIVLYSTLDPEASAMLVEDELITWIGAEDSAQALHPDAEQIDATGCLVTPGFVDAASTADGSAPDPGETVHAAASGIVMRLPGPTGMRDGVHVLAPLSESAPYRTLTASGVPLALGSAGVDEHRDPWAWVRAVSEQGPAQERLSARAAYLAATRGGLRLAGVWHPGSLQTALPATFVIWEPWDLTVRGTGSERDTWSADPRARTPLLPDHSAGTPRALRTVSHGEILHDMLDKVTGDDG